MTETEKIQFKATLQMLMPMVIQTVMDNTGVSVETAIRDFYSSQLYKDMENEKTKLWHLSPFALFELFEMEQKTGKIIYPEEA